ncbi:hypothetical protein [Candidatus Nitrotoga fabula]|uniref:hypothetical protein n=1 Tax=Candidatus Nitrotoga fabula TaxID=2182327 RepID=UPI001BB47695|nr:hypothetical protein [Candidatus Nitrotoga fabula]
MPIFFAMAGFESSSGTEGLVSLSLVLIDNTRAVGGAATAWSVSAANVDLRVTTGAGLPGRVRSVEIAGVRRMNIGDSGIYDPFMMNGRSTIPFEKIRADCNI